MEPETRTRPLRREQTYVYLWTYRQFQVEQAEWNQVNKVLQQHGFKPVLFMDPLENRNLPDVVLLEQRTVSQLRATLRTVLTDRERRQALLQELLHSNNQLREEVLEQTGRAAQQAQRVKELQEVLEQVRSRVQDQEERCLRRALQQQSRIQQLQEEKQEAERRCLLLEQNRARLEEEATRLRKKIHFTAREEEQRRARQNRTACRPDSLAQQRIQAKLKQHQEFFPAFHSLMTRILEVLGVTRMDQVLPALQTLKQAAPFSVDPDLVSIATPSS